jgi:uncharacterized protein (DUF1810 family)
MSLERFHQAQDGKWSGYATALAEIRAGEKRSHWIWYIFPQLDGLGRSSTARSFALRDLEEACAYLQDPVLRSRYLEIAGAVAEQLAGVVSVEELMGGSTDARKLASSLTLFRAAAARLATGEREGDFTRLAELTESILGRIAEEGYPACGFTLERCTGPSRAA